MIQERLRKEDERLQFCDAYFDAVGAKTVAKRSMYREYVLPRDVDKELTDRPFYWLWAEKTNQTVEPTTLRLAFNSSAKRREDERLVAEHDAFMQENPPQNRYEMMFRKPKQSEHITLGCFRLNKIIDSVLSRGSLVSVTPSAVTSIEKLVPWLVVNGLVKYTSDSVQEEWFSQGICLANLQVVEGFFDKIGTIPMRVCNPNDVLRHATHSIEEGMDRVQQSLRQQLTEKDHEWARDAYMRLEDDLSQLDTYYRSVLHEHAEDEQTSLRLEHERKRDELIRKTSPRIELEPLQLGIVGLPVRG